MTHRLAHSGARRRNLQAVNWKALRLVAALTDDESVLKVIRIETGFTSQDLEDLFKDIIWQCATTTGRARAAGRRASELKTKKAAARARKIIKAAGVRALRKRRPYWSVSAVIAHIRSVMPELDESDETLRRYLRLQGIVAVLRSPRK